jgi:hypothetical protein
MAAILPKCAAMMLAAVISAGETSLKLLHHRADPAFFRFNGKFVSESSNSFGANLSSWHTITLLGDGFGSSVTSV